MLTWQDYQARPLTEGIYVTFVKSAPVNSSVVFAHVADGHWEISQVLVRLHSAFYGFHRSQGSVFEIVEQVLRADVEVEEGL